MEKFSLYIGLFSEGAYGAIQIPDLNFYQSQIIALTCNCLKFGYLAGHLFIAEL